MHLNKLCNKQFGNKIFGILLLFSSTLYSSKPNLFGLSDLEYKALLKDKSHEWAYVPDKTKAVLNKLNISLSHPNIAELNEVKNTIAQITCGNIDGCLSEKDLCHLKKYYKYLESGDAILKTGNYRKRKGKKKKVYIICNLLAKHKIKKSKRKK